MKQLILTAAALVFSGALVAQLSFTNSSQLLNQTFNSGGCVGVNDMNGDGLDDIVHMNESRRVMVEYQNPDGSFTLYDYGQVSGSNQWGMTIGDVDANGHNDVLSGGNSDGVHLVMIDAPGVSQQLSLPNGAGLFMQACNMADINNDGHTDVFACHDVGTSRIWGNDGTGTLVPELNWIDLNTVPASDNSGNYGSVWTDVNNDGHLDLYIAKCRQGVSNPLDPRRINQLFLNDGNGNYTEVADERGLVIFSQSWTADFADIDNDGDMDCLITNHDTTIKLLENDGNGFFTDITAGSGLEITGFFLQAMMRDFDNDGFVDVIYAGGVHGYLKGNGNGTFTPQGGMFPYSDTMHSFGIGDLNNDGFLDVYSSYGNGYVSIDNNNPDILWLNDTNDNNYFAVNLQGTVSNINAIGARVEIYGDWGVQIREVRAGESYGINNSFQLHFGLGQSTEVETMVIKWPSGLQETFSNLAANSAITVIENTCIAEPVAITSDGPAILCEGGSLTLTATAGESYLWSNGETTQSIVVTEEGAYSVTVTSEGGCPSVAPMLMVTVEPDETPEVTVEGELQFCEGESVTLTSSEASGYAWSNGDDAQSIVVTQTGEYSVTIEGVCGDFTSEVISVEVFDAPAAPFAEGDIIPAPGTAQLTAIGNDLRWYDVPVGGEILGTGPNFETPFINETTSFYVEDANIVGGEIVFGGKEDNSGPGGMHSNSSFFLKFDAFEDIIIKSVLVYANGSGNRTIRATDSNGTIIAEGVYNIPDGESRVDIEFEIPAGTGYELKTTGNPQLYRNGEDNTLAYPYALGDMGAITGTNIQGSNEFNYYYFFYDWEVQRPESGCVSDRVEVLAVVDTTTSGIEEDDQMVFDLFPVPASDIVNLELSFAGVFDLQLLDVSGKTLLNEQRVANEGDVQQINLQGLATGLYFVKVINGEDFGVRRLVIR